MNFILNDLRYAWRSALRSPCVTLAIIAMLALGMGGVTAVFNPLYATFFAPLPFPQSEQLMFVGGKIPIYNMTFRRFENEEGLKRIFSSLTTYASFPATTITVPDTGKTKQIVYVDVQEDFFETLGILPLRGYDFKHTEIKQGVVISNRFWRNELMGADDAIGKLIQVSLYRLPIIGIMAESFDFPAGADIWLHIKTNMGSVISTDRQFLGRLKPGMSPVKAAEMLRYMEFKPGIGLTGKDGPILQSMQTVLRGDRWPILLMLGAAAILFLLLVCAGVMNLLIAQGTRRKSEITMRLIFGATRFNLVFQLLREVLPLVAIGAFTGVWISEIASDWLMAQFPTLTGNEVIVPVKMAFFVALVSVVTLIGGLTPALYASSGDLNTHIKSGSDSRRYFLPFGFTLQELLVGAQLSLALALLTGVGLLVNNMMFHVVIPIRWASNDIAVVRAEFPVKPGSLEYSSAAIINRSIFYHELENNLNTMPEVANTGIFRPIPFSADAVRASQRGSAAFNAPSTQSFYSERMGIQVIEGYANPVGFRMLELPLIAGRHFSPVEMAKEIEFQIKRWDKNTDGASLRGTIGGVVIVNQSLAKRFWPGENAVGKMIYNSTSIAYEIVGVVRDFQQVGNNKNVVPAVYYPPDSWRPQNQTFLVKLHSWSFIRDFVTRLYGFDAGEATIEVQPLEEIISNVKANTRMTAQLLGSFAVLGIVVAGLGVFTSASLMAASWNREMGIRMAMGAQKFDILRLALWRGMRASIIGLPLGIFLAWILSQVLSSYLVQVKINDPFVWIISCAVLLTTTTIAALIPAVRAIRINPLDVMRNE